MSATAVAAPMKIVVADDHQIIRKGLQLIVSTQAGWAVAAEAENASQLFTVLGRASYDVLVLDLRLREDSALELLPRIRREHPSLPVLVLSSQPEEHYAIAALRAGARGYIQKDASADEIIEAIERVAAGRTRVSERIAELMADELSSPRPVGAPHERLSSRERDVFLRLASGQTVGDIAAALGVSVKTISTYRTRILEKTGFRSNADIVAYAVRMRLLS